MTFRKLSQLFVILSLILATVANGVSPYPSVFAQADIATPDGTPESEIHFGLVPVGDHPQGYFSDVPVNAGETTTLEVNVVNFGNVGVELLVYVTNAHNGMNGGFSPGAYEEEPAGLTSWIDFPEQVIFLEPSSQMTIPFAITPPADIGPGQYISTIAVVMTTAADVPGTDIVTQKQRYAISLGVLVPGDLVHSFELGEPFLENDMLTIPLQNTGNFLVRPEGILTLTDAQGNEIINSPVNMGSVYGGNESSVAKFLPPQLAYGDYVLNLEITDPESGATASINEQAFNIPEPEDPAGLFLREYSIEPNAEEIVFANVSAMLENGGGPISATNVTLEVSHNGEVVEEFPLATNQLIATGENTLEARYLPAEMWESGTYTFRIIVTSVNPNDGTEVELLTENLDAEIIVP